MKEKTQKVSKDLPGRKKRQGSGTEHWSRQS
jgi:hypothetical protein